MKRYLWSVAGLRIEWAVDALEAAGYAVPHDREYVWLREKPLDVTRETRVLLVVRPDSTMCREREYAHEEWASARLDLDQLAREGT